MTRNRNYIETTFDNRKVGTIDESIGESIQRHCVNHRNLYIFFPDNLCFDKTRFSPEIVRNENKITPPVRERSITAPI